MKKLFALVALVLGVVSCQTDPNDLDVVVGGEQDVMLTVSLPEATRANSANGFQIADLGDTYDLRYILEVYRVNDAGTILYDNCQRQVKRADAATMSFPVRLAPHYKYQIVAWADIVNDGSDADRLYKTTEGLDAIEILSWDAMDETRDAYTGTKYIADFSSSSDLSMALTRPFAKVRVVATDINDITDLGLSPKAATVSYLQDMYTKYNAVTAEASAAEPKSHNKYTSFPYTDATGEMTLFADYVFVPESGTAKFSLNVYDDADATRLIKDNSFSTDIFVERNKITTIKGDVLTEGGNVSITVDNDLGEKVTINMVDTADDLQEIINNTEDGESANIKLGGDIDLGDLLNAGILSTRAATRDYIYIAEDKTLTLDLNGFKISQSDVENKYAFNNHGTFIIKDSKGGGSINARGIYNGYGEGAENVATAKIIVESGVINAKGTNGGAAIYNYGVVEVKGGKFESNGGYGLNNQSGASMTITGGEIRGGIYNCGTLSIDGENTSVYQHLSGKHAIYNWSATATINNGAFDSESGNELILADGQDCSVTINGGTFDKTAKSWLMGAATGKNITFVINGGTFRGYVNQPEMTVDTFRPYGDPIVVCGGNFNFNPTQWLSDDHTVEVENGLWTVELKNVIAKIGEVEYRTLQKAFDAVEEGANTIVLVDGVNVNAAVVLAEGKTATLDLNGKTLTATDYAIENNGTLTITGDGTINGVVYGENGTTTVENGTFNPADGGAYVFLNSTAGTLIINGGTINTGSSYPVYSYNENNKLIINDVIINGKFGCVNAYGTNGSVEINGGTFQMTGVQGKTSHITYFSSNIVATINGGTFEKIGDISMSAAGGGGICANGGANLTINGGTFAGDHDDVYNYGGTISVKGGEYKFKPDFVAAGYGAVEENGVWKVAKAYDITEQGATIYSAAGMFWFANEVNVNKNAFNGKTVTLANDIDLNNENWAGIGTEEANFCGTFDGRDYTIKNLKILVSEGKEDKAYLGLFGYAKNATIKNVVFENVDINVACLDIDHSQGHIGAVAGSLEGTSTIENVTVQGDVKVYATQDANGASRVAVVAGGNAYGNVTMKNVHVLANEGSYLIANNNTGALAGQLQGKSVFENCSSNIDVTVNKFFAGGIIGLAAGDQTFTNCHTTGNIAVVAGREGRAHDQYRVGGIAGGWADGKNNVCTLVNCSYTGNVSGKNSDGSVANPLDYMGYVGRGYTLNGCQGSTVNIDGVRYVQKYDTAAEAGIYDVYDVDGNLIIIDGVVQTPEGNYLISKAAGMFWFANEVNSGANYFEGKTIKLGADIDLNNAEWTPIGSAYKDHGFMGNFDGNGKIIKNLKITALTPDADQYVYGGLFGVTEGVDKDNQNYIKNFTIENVNIDLDGDIVAAAVAYPYYTALENIKVKGNVSIKGKSYTSGVLAYTRRCVDAKNISIEANAGSVIEGTQTVGGVISDIQMNGGLTANYSNFKAENLTIKGAQSVGGISGIIAAQNLDGAIVKNVAIESNDIRTGKISGSFDGNSVITNAVVENVTGADYYIGCLYSGTASDTSSVTINGDVYTYNNGWIVNGNLI